MHKKIKGFFGKIWPGAFSPIWGFIIAVGAVVGMIVWAALKRWFASPWAPFTIPLVALLILIVFSALNQIKKHRKGTIINYQQLIVGWLFKYGYSIQKILGDNRAEWMIKATHPDGRVPFFVSAPKTEPDFVAIFVDSQFVPDDQAEIDKITAKPNSTLLEELRIEMARLGFEYRGLEHPLRSISLGQKMAKDDSLTELAFLQTALRVRSACNLYLSVISKYRKLNPSGQP